MFTLIHNNTQISTRVRSLLEEQGIECPSGDCALIDTQNYTVNADQIKHILEMLGMWAVDLVQRDHEEWVDSHLNEESDDSEIIAFITENPHVMRHPILIKNNRTAVLCEIPEEAFRLFV